VTPIGKGYQSIDGGQNFRNQPVGGLKVISANEFPDLVKIKAGFRVEIISDHEPGGVRRAASLFSRKWAITASREIGFTRLLLRSS
jgi:hypothetical protein